MASESPKQYRWRFWLGVCWVVNLELIAWFIIANADAINKAPPAIWIATEIAVAVWMFLTVCMVVAGATNANAFLRSPTEGA